MNSSSKWSFALLVRCEFAGEFNYILAVILQKAERQKHFIGRQKQQSRFQPVNLFLLRNEKFFSIKTDNF